MTERRVALRPTLLILVVLVLMALTYVMVPVHTRQANTPLHLGGWSLDGSAVAAGRYRVTYEILNVGSTPMRLQSIRLVPDLRHSLPVTSAAVALDTDGQSQSAEVGQDGSIPLRGRVLGGRQSLTLALELRVADPTSLKLDLQAAPPAPPHSSIQVSCRRCGQPWITEVAIRHP